MKKKSKIWGIIPAAGIGSRMATDYPKQYCQIGEVSVLHHTLSRICKTPRIEGVILGISADDKYWEPSLFKSNRLKGCYSGGKNRDDTVRNGLIYLLDKMACDENDWALIHDAARPCIVQSDINALIDEAEINQVGAVLGIKVTDTLKTTDADGRVIQTVDRKAFWRAFTPQIFRIGTLLSALERAKAEGIVVTDECMAMEYSGFHPVMVQGHASNIKITVAGDLDMAALYQEVFQ